MCVVALNHGMNTCKSITAKKTIVFGDFHQALLNEGVRIPAMAKRMFEKPITGLRAK